MIDRMGNAFATTCAIVCKRLVGNPPVIRIVTFDQPCPYFVAPTRFYTGINKMRKVPPPETARFLEHELQNGVPRSAMGKSIFDLAGRLYRVAFRALGVPQEISTPLRSDFLVITSDIENAQGQLLLKHFLDTPYEGRRKLANL